MLATIVPTVENGGIVLGPDGRMTVTYHLRPGVTWQDRPAFTAADVKFTWEAVRDPAFLAESKTGSDDIESIDTPDPLTAIVNYRRTSAAFASTFTFGILPRHLLHYWRHDATARWHAHQMSGGMQQRVMIAMALAYEPALLVADEPTTALDVTVQAQILRLLRKLQDSFGLGVLFITHNLHVVAEIVDRVEVMYGGEVVGSAPVETLFSRHPCMRGLIASLPAADAASIDPAHHGRHRLPVVRGTVVDPRAPPAGCRFAPLCDFVQAACELQVPGETEISPAHRVRRLRWTEIA